MKAISRCGIAASVLALACTEPPTEPQLRRMAALQLAITTGSWYQFPEAAAIYQTSVQQPINADGSSSFRANGNSVIPVKFALAAGLSAPPFESISSDAGLDNDYSYVTFTPSPSVTFATLTNLKANYAFTLGDCHGGALRWSVRLDVGNDGIEANDGSIWIYYGSPPHFGNSSLGGCTPTSPSGGSQTGVNMIGLSDVRYDASQLGGAIYGLYADALANYGTLNVLRASLVLDGGWAGDQRLTLGTVTVNDNVLTPPVASPLTPTCALPDAQIKVTKIANAPTGPVNGATSRQPADNNSVFRRVDCKYMYNLATGSLFGAGTYLVEALIGSTLATGGAVFDLR